MEGGTPVVNPLAGLARMAAFVTGCSVFLRGPAQELLAAAGTMEPIVLPIVSERAVLVHDAKVDPRFSSHPAVCGAPYVRFWASLPIVSADGTCLGRLEVADVVPRILGDDRARALDDLRVQAAFTLSTSAQGAVVLRHVLAGLPLPVFTVHVDVLGSAQILDANAAARAVACQPIEMLVGRPIEEVLPWSALHRISERCARVVSSGEREGFDLNLAVGTSGDLLFHIELMPVYGRRLVVVVEDRSHQHELQRRKDAFIEIVSHELRTPLAMLGGAIGLLDGGVGGALPEPAARLVRLARDGSDRLSRIVQDLLDIEQIRSGVTLMQKEGVAIGALLELSSEAVGKQARSGGVGVRTGRRADVRVFGDRERLAQAFANLLSNAVRHSPSGRPVTVDAWQPDPLRVRVDIRDEGRGLTPEEERALFTILPASKGGTGGLGLGLAIARLVVEAHGGTIGAVTSREQGTTWWVELPVLA